MKCTKARIIDTVAEINVFPREKAIEVTEIMLELIKNTLTSGEDMLISGFGKFQVREKADRIGRNPATGDSMMLRERRVVTFKCSQKMREKINGWQ